MKLACAADIHGKRGLTWPEADVLVLAGDILPTKSHDKVRDTFLQRRFFEEDLLPKLAGLKQRAYRDIIVVPGNHDRLFATETYSCRESFKKLGIHFLIDEACKIQGKMFWGSPWTPWFGGHHWVYNFPNPEANFARARAHARNCWAQIPDNTDVIVTHGPAYGIRDYTNSLENVGCPFLLEVIKKVQPSLHVCGHIHEGSGVAGCNGGKTICVNASICDARYNATNLVRVVNI